MDADHISAIDNATRTRMSDGNRPSVGFFFFFVFFSLGHSSVVCALAFVFDINTLGFIIAGMAL